MGRGRGRRVARKLKLQITGGQANPAPPVGPALGQAQVNIGEFVRQFNDATRDQMGQIIPVEITVYEDRYPPRLARAVREHQRAAHHLIGAPGVHVEVDVGFDALVELRAVQALQQLQRLARRVALLRVYPRLLFKQFSTH